MYGEKREGIILLEVNAETFLAKVTPPMTVMGGSQVHGQSQRCTRDNYIVIDVKLSGLTGLLKLQSFEHGKHSLYVGTCYVLGRENSVCGTNKIKNDINRFGSDFASQEQLSSVTHLRG